MSEPRFGLRSAFRPGVTNLLPLAGLEQLLASLLAAIPQPEPRTDAVSEDTSGFPEIFEELAEADPQDRKGEQPLVPALLTMPLPAPPPAPVPVPELRVVAGGGAGDSPAQTQAERPVPEATEEIPEDIDTQPEQAVVVEPSWWDRPPGLSHKNPQPVEVAILRPSVGQPSPAAAGLRPGAAGLIPFHPAHTGGPAEPRPKGAVPLAPAQMSARIETAYLASGPVDDAPVLAEHVPPPNRKKREMVPAPETMTVSVPVEPDRSPAPLQPIPHTEAPDPPALRVPVSQQLLAPTPTVPEEPKIEPSAFRAIEKPPVQLPPVPNEPSQAERPDDTPSVPAPLAFAARLVPMTRERAEPVAPTAGHEITQPMPASHRPEPESEVPLPIAPVARFETETPKRARVVELIDPESPKHSRDVAPETPSALDTIPASVHPAALEPRYVSERVEPPKLIDVPRPPEPIVESTPLKSPPRTHDIQVAVADEGRRVDLRLSDRAGEIQVTVRTPDTALAGDLRENLPSLSSRLEAVGFRSEPLHAAPLSQPEPARAFESPVASDGQLHERSTQQRDQHDTHRPKQQEEQPNRKKKGREFEWLISSLR